MGQIILNIIIITVLLCLGTLLTVCMVTLRIEIPKKSSEHCGSEADI